MTIKEAILKSLEELKKLSTHNDVYEQIINNKYYEWASNQTPKQTVSALMWDFIKKNDTRVKRIKGKGKGKGNYYLYYLSKYEEELNINDFVNSSNKIEKKVTNHKKTYQERDLHTLLSTYLKSKNIYSKTILHEESKNSKDEHQKWIHPDMIGIELLHLKSKINKAFMKVLNKSETFSLTSYEIKKEINTDYDLKKYYFQAVSNSSWANYGYLVAFEINDNLKAEMERLNQSFGIGIIKLEATPFESKVLFQPEFKELDFKTIDKLCKINTKYEKFIELIEKTLSVEERYYKSIEKELQSFCDSYFENDSDIDNYCKEKNIPYYDTNNID